MDNDERRGMRDLLPSSGVVSSPRGQEVSPESLVLRTISSNPECDCPYGVLNPTDNLHYDDISIEIDLPIRKFNAHDSRVFKTDAKTAEFKNERLWLCRGYGTKRKAKRVVEFFDSFKRMKAIADEKMIFYDTESNEFVRVSKASRWSGNGKKYKNNVIRKIRSQTYGLRRVTMLTLTFDKNRIREIAMLENWPYWQTDEGINQFILRYGAEMVGAFLKRLRSARQRRELAWNYIAWVLQLFNRRGEVHIHFHLLFVGQWIAKLSDLQRMWPYSDPQHVDVKPMRNNDVAGYISRYVGRELGMLCETGREWIAAFIWHFKRRLYSCRRYLRGGIVDEPDWKKPNLIYVGIERDGLIVLDEKFILSHIREPDFSAIADDGSIYLDKLKSLSLV